MKNANSFWLSGEKEVDEESFVQKMKQFVSQPDAKERVKELADTIFGLISANNNGVISYNEFCQFYKAMNVSQELIDTLFKQADTNEDGVIDHLDSQEIYAKYFLT